MVFLMVALLADWFAVKLISSFVTQLLTDDFSALTVAYPHPILLQQQLECVLADKQ